MSGSNHRGDVTISTRARHDRPSETFTLALTLGALEEIERETGHASFVEALNAMGGSEADGTPRHPSAKAIGAFVRACIRAGGADLTDEEIVALPFAMPDVLEAIGKLTAAIAPEQEGDGKSPARPQRRTGRAGS